MEFVHKNIAITVESDGLFHFKMGANKMVADSLHNAETRIDTLLESYYTITKEDFKHLMDKLDAREKDWLKDLILSLKCHRNNAYCELGVKTEFNNSVVFDAVTSNE